MKKRTEAFLLLLHNTFLIIFCVKNTTKIRQNFRFCWIKKIQNVFKEISFCKFLEYYSIMIRPANLNSLVSVTKNKFVRNKCWSVSNVLGRRDTKYLHTQICKKIPQKWTNFRLGTDHIRSFAKPALSICFRRQLLSDTSLAVVTTHVPIRWISG